MEIRVLTSSSVHSRGLDDFIASQMICGKCSNGLQFGRTGGQSCEPLEEKIGGEVTTARQWNRSVIRAIPLLLVLDLGPRAANKKTARRRSLYAGGVALLSLIRCTSMVVQAYSASASVLKGEPPTFMALLF